MAHLQEAIADALGAWQNQSVEVHERDSHGDRTWSGRLDRAAERHSHSRQGLVVLVNFLAPTTGEQARSLEFAGGRVVSADFGRSASERHDTLTITEAHDDGPRIVTITPLGARPEETAERLAPTAAEVDAEHVAQVDEALLRFVNDNRGRDVLIRRGVEISEAGGPLRDLERAADRWVILFGEDGRFEISHGGLQGSTAGVGGLQVWTNGSYVTLRVPRYDDMEIDGAEGCGIF